jgi:hypothetical protein
MNTRTGAVWFLLYVVWMSLLVGGLFWGRSTAMRAYSGPEAQAQWQSFREDMERISHEGPVKRRVPESREPPALRLMRDYFGVSLAATIVFGSLLFVMVMGAVRGAFTADFEPKNSGAS